MSPASSHQILIDAVELARIQELADRSHRYREQFWHVLVTLGVLAAVAVVYGVLAGSHVLLLLICCVLLIALLIP
jgi:hypothetical protein